nr:glycosyltransferase [candidate division Zixibacteria bacterium]
MKILMLADGCAFHAVRYQTEMKNQGVEIILASLERGETVDILLKKKSVSNSLNYFFINRQIKELVRKIDPDIVNPHFASGYGFSTAVSRVWKKRSVVLHCLGSDILISPKKSIAHRRRVVYALTRANYVLADSNYLAENIRKLASVRNLEIIPWGVEKEILELFELKKTSGFRWHHPLRILVPRPHNRVYNNEFIVRTLAPRINRKEIQLTFPAWGEDIVDFEILVRDLCPGGGIDFYHMKPRTDYIRFLADHDIYLSASLSDSSPASLIEAMGCGMLPIVADIPGIRDWAISSNSILYDPHRPETLDETIDRLPHLELEPILITNHAKVAREAIWVNNIRATIEIMERVAVGRS